MQLSQGACLIEILMSFLIASISLLGVDATLIISLQRAKSGFYFSIAVEQLNVMTERMEVLKRFSSVRAFNEWNKQNEEVLPGGRGTLQNEGSSQVLSIFWGTGEKGRCQKNQLGQAGCLRVTLKN